ncbi:uncharacterized protein BO66DRAFT_249234 [Aspergillus aculeatinus CBS 121060]|uniref:Uncharacterized protein n=1 Tax=Aspergillus aculeatinus CBS 121060 TaxID=1448322 RepID=A0ACD1HGW8_9EURO|nr:hypothetical protein BO66DRAFT_249234 [Aspergillus aculeatinus CBS 121060]RAH72869.1 hypothetical protein BO66DRAFT_249234 [Aspergillus aculeatinus CBS 121060]
MPVDSGSHEAATVPSELPEEPAAAKGNLVGVPGTLAVPALQYTSCSLTLHNAHSIEWLHSGILKKTTVDSPALSTGESTYPQSNRCINSSLNKRYAGVFNCGSKLPIPRQKTNHIPHTAVHPQLIWLKGPTADLISDTRERGGQRHATTVANGPAVTTAGTALRRYRN